MIVIDLMKAMSHETRLRVLHLLSHKEALCVCDLDDILKMPQPTVSRHLKILKDKGLVKDFRKNQWVHYQINDAMDASVRKVIDAALGLCVDASVFKNDLLRLEEKALAACC